MIVPVEIVVITVEENVYTPSEGSVVMPQADADVLITHNPHFDDATYDRVFDTNVRGVFSSMRAQIPALKATRGSIILTSSTAGSRGFPGASIYTASKHAVEGIMKAAAHELAPFGVRVNVVAPGPTITDMLDRFTGEAHGTPPSVQSHSATAFTQ
jgi:NAD(P)-dependent dehydrogenase (short-subunit alcohol dehydrogenase family)